MKSKLKGRIAIVTGASSGIGAETARRLAEEGVSVAVVARRMDRLDALVTDIVAAGGTAYAITADISDRIQAESAVNATVDHFGRLDILVNNAGLMLLGPVVGADIEDWERMIGINAQAMLYMTHASLPHLLHSATENENGIADVVNISSQAGRIATRDFAVYNLTKFGMNGFSEALRQEVTQRHVRVGVIEPGAVETELGSHNSEEIQTGMLNPFNEQHEVLHPDDIADAVVYMVSRPRHASVAELWVMPTDQP